MGSAKAFVPATVGNVGPGFDVLGLAVSGLGDEVDVTLIDSDRSEVGRVEGRDADQVPMDPEKNVAVIAAEAMLRKLNVDKKVRVNLSRKIPLAGGLGSSAAASVGGALAACAAAESPYDAEKVIAAAAVGERSLGADHLDNIIPCVLGGLTICFAGKGKRVPIKGDWYLALCSPNIRVKTSDARMILPKELETKVWVNQMANTSALVAAFMTGDTQLARVALNDVFAEPKRKMLISNFDAVKASALEAGAVGVSISGSGPTVFALCDDVLIARHCGEAMEEAFKPFEATVHFSKIAESGATIL